MIQARCLGPGVTSLRLCTAALTGLLMLAACNSSAPTSPAATAPVTATRALCFESCDKTQILTLPQLENQHFTAGGRYFLSGQLNFYEVTRDAAGTLQSHAFFADGQGCAGMASDAKNLWVLCPSPSSTTAPAGGSSVYRLALDVRGAVPKPIFALSNMSLPNGMVLGPDHALYITDGPVATEPKIVRVKLDPVNADHVLGQETWVLTMPQYPNGLALIGQQFFTTLYGTEMGTIGRLTLKPDGSADSFETFYSRGHIMDDLSVAADGTLLVAEFETGKIFQLGADGKLLHEAPAMTFSQPSSALQGQPPLFTGDEILVTERYSGGGLWTLKRKAQ